jgi:hypothetical protein
MMNKEKIKIFVSCSEESSKDKPNRCGDQWKRRITSIFTYGKMSRESFNNNFQFNLVIWNKTSHYRNGVRHLTWSKRFQNSENKKKKSNLKNLLDRLRPTQILLDVLITNKEKMETFFS